MRNKIAARQGKQIIARDYSGKRGGTVSCGVDGVRAIGILQGNRHLREVGFAFERYLNGDVAMRLLRSGRFFIERCVVRKRR